MRISELRLKNFRNFESGVFHLDPNFTVVIGVNGRGKSTLLHALRVVCGTYFLGIPDVKSRHIDPDEIRVVDNQRYLAQQVPVIVEALGRFAETGATDIVWRRKILSSGSGNTSPVSDVGTVRDLGRSKYLQMMDGGPDSDHLDLPVIAYFGTKRLHGAARNRGTQQRTGRQIFVEGYRDWFEMRSTTFLYESWLSTIEVLSSRGRDYPSAKEVFIRALRDANPRYLKEIEIVNGKLWISVEVEGYPSQFLPIHLHSDGIVTYTEMVAEIACRCLILNGYKGTDAVVDTCGIVMIDEIDLHLHPSWQKHVVADLKAAFPKIQFVASTHSPMIVQSLQTSELINLDGADPTGQPPSNLPLNKVVTQIMGVKDIRSDDFLNRHVEARARLSELSQQNGGLTVDDYEEMSRLLGGMILEEADDPILTAYLEETEAGNEAN